MSEVQHHDTDRLARRLGWASMGLGVVQLAVPDVVRRVGGVEDSPWARVLVPLVGVREWFHAATLLGSRRPAPWVWTRVAGDAVDLTALGCAVARRSGPRRRRVVASTTAVAGLTAVDLYTAVRASRLDRRHGMTLHAAITVKRSPKEVYGFWRNVSNLPRFMVHLQSVRVIDEWRSHWIAKGPAGRSIEWDAEVVDDQPGELIAWRSTGDPAVRNSGYVRFTQAPGGRGTEVRVELRFEPPGGRAGAAVAKLLGEYPDQQIRDDLRRFKQVMETGEVVRSDGSPEGIHAGGRLRQRPAQPVMTGGTW
jgi:uncharacterized membrane protein